MKDILIYAVTIFPLLIYIYIFGVSSDIFGLFTKRKIVDFVVFLNSIIKIKWKIKKLLC